MPVLEVQAKGGHMKEDVIERFAYGVMALSVSFQHNEVMG